jgi:superoxide reductase
VYLETVKGGQRKTLKPGDKPEVSFSLTADDKAIAAFEYCNLHGLWKANV